MEINEATASRENANIGILLPLIFIPKHPKRSGSILGFHFICCSAQFISANILFVNHNEERKTVSLKNEKWTYHLPGRGGGGVLLRILNWGQSSKNLEFQLALWTSSSQILLALVKS